LAFGNRGQQPEQVGPVERRERTRHRSGAREVDRVNAGMCHRAAHQDGVHHPRQDEIGDEQPLAGQQATIFAPQQRAPDVGGPKVVHFRTPLSGAGRKYLQILRWADHRPPHMRDRAVVEPQPFLWLAEITADDVGEFFQLDMHIGIKRIDVVDRDHPA
jgi:hypothetical protein